MPMKDDIPSLELLFPGDRAWERADTGISVFAEEIIKGFNNLKRNIKFEWRENGPFKLFACLVVVIIVVVILKHSFATLLDRLV